MWVAITLAAALCQVLRTSRQHELRAVLSTPAAGYVRYLYGAPMALIAGAIVFGALGRDLPAISWRFWPVVAGAGIAQIVATIALLESFKMRDFAVGTVFAKSEVILVALVGAIGLGEPLEALGWVGAALVTVGVAGLAADGRLLGLLSRAGDGAALLGLVAGGLFAVTAVGIRGASGHLSGDPFDRALVTLTVMLVVQTLANGAAFIVTGPAEISATVRAWRSALPVGVLSLAGSMGWAWAMTLENAAKVRALGQVELVVAFAVARLVLGERHGPAEHLGGLAVVVGVVMVALLG
jgi:drug/metabolite transporter (DMT)-like permease